MIVKKIKCKKTSKTKARQIADLVDYIRQPRGMDSAEKIEHSGSRNFLASRHESQRLEMIALAAESIHSRMPVTHYVFFLEGALAAHGRAGGRTGGYLSQGAWP